MTRAIESIINANRRAFQFDGSVYEYHDDQIVISTQPERQEIIDWCTERDMDIDLLWAGYSLDEIKSVWGFKNEEHKVMFTLRWS